MIKYIYKTVGLLLIFVGALFFLEAECLQISMTPARNQSCRERLFPYITLTTQGQKINTLYGYGETTDANVIRETVTPLNDSKTILFEPVRCQDSLNKDFLPDPG